MKFVSEFADMKCLRWPGDIMKIEGSETPKNELEVVKWQRQAQLQTKYRNTKQIFGKEDLQ